MIGRGMFDNVTEYKGPDNNDGGNFGGGNDDGSQVNHNQPANHQPNQPKPVTLTNTNQAPGPAMPGTPSLTQYERPMMNLGVPNNGGGGGNFNISSPGFKPTSIKEGSYQKPDNVNVMNAQQTMNQVGDVRPVTTQIGQDALVQNQLNNLLNQDNAYMQDATTQGKQAAAAAGLMNSSMGIGAVQQARIRAALPIAQQDASLYGQANLQDSAYLQQAGLSEQAFGQNAALSDQSFGQNQQLANQQFGHNQHLANQQFGHNQQLTNQQGQIAQQAAAQQGAINAQLQSANNQFQAGQNQMSTLATMEQNLQNQIANIEQNPDTPPAIKQQQIQALMNAHQQSIQQINNWSQQINGYKKSTQQARTRINSNFKFRG